MANWLYKNAATPYGQCAASAFEDAAGNAVWKTKVTNTGYCSTTATYGTLYDGVKQVLSKLSEGNCKRCCAALTHGGRWRGEIAVTTDGSDPWQHDCQSSDASAYYECKQNEHGDAVCSERQSLHDEF